MGTGTVIAILFSEFLASQIKIQEIKNFDTVAYLLAIGVVALAATAAACVPMRRAVSVDPVEILRYE